MTEVLPPPTETQYTRFPKFSKSTNAHKLTVASVLLREFLATTRAFFRPDLLLLEELRSLVLLRLRLSLELSLIHI